MNCQLVILFIFSFISLTQSFPQTKAVQGKQTLAPNNSTVPSPGLIGPAGDHQDWAYRNGEYIPDQQDHFRFHCYLAMSIYGDYPTLCPKTFTRGFQVLQVFSSGYIARVEEMKKIVIVFRGISDLSLVDFTAASVSGFVKDCPNCMVAAGVRNRYLELRRETNDFQVARDAVKASIQNGVPQMLFSVTGLGFGGALAALCGLHLGSLSLVNFAHNSGTFRFMNDAAVIKYDNIFQFLAGQSIVHNNDFAVQLQPQGIYSHMGQKIQISGPGTRWYTNCFGNNENRTCLGDGSSKEDHTYYFTPIGQCGSADKGF